MRGFGRRMLKVPERPTITMSRAYGDLIRPSIENNNHRKHDVPSLPNGPDDSHARKSHAVGTMLVSGKKRCKKRCRNQSHPRDSAFNGRDVDRHRQLEFQFQPQPPFGLNPFLDPWMIARAQFAYQMQQMHHVHQCMQAQFAMSQHMAMMNEMRHHQESHIGYQQAIPPRPFPASTSFHSRHHWAPRCEQGADFMHLQTHLANQDRFTELHSSDDDSQGTSDTFQCGGHDYCVATGAWLPPKEYVSEQKFPALVVH